MYHFKLSLISLVILLTLLITARPGTATSSPTYLINLHVIVTANDDGSQAAMVSHNSILHGVKLANQHYKPAGIQFTFDPATDIEKIHSTLLNQDVTVPSNVSLTGLPDPPFETQHVVYRGTDRHIYELFYKVGYSGWRMNDLTRMVDLPLAKSKPSGYTTDAGAMQHIVYVGSNNHIYELFYKVGYSGWRVNDLTLSAGLTVSPVGNPVGYITPGDVQHVVYRGRDSHIYELFTGPGDPKWYWNRLTQAAGAPLAAGDPTAYVTALNTNHVVYRGTDCHIYELFYGPGLPNWRMNDLTQAAGAPLAVGNPVGYTTGWDTIQHVVYRAANNHIYELFYPSSDPSWGLNGLTQAAGAPQAASDPAAYLTDDFDGGIGEIQHVVYRAANNHIYELFYPSSDPSWGLNGLTQAAGAPLAAGAPTAYTVNERKDQHVIYTGTDGRIHELFYVYGRPGGTNWQTNDLSLDADAPANSSGSPSVYTHGAGDYYSNRAARNRIANQHLGKLVVYINYGTKVEEDTATNQWIVKQRPGSFSNFVDNFVSLGSNTGGGELGHEIGHYFHLPHTFGPQPKTKAEAEELIRVYVDDQGNSKSDGAKVFDADDALIGDTPPDPGPDLWVAMKGNQCSSSDTIQLTVRLKSGSQIYTLQPMRQNLMSYFRKDCKQFSKLMFFTNDQIARMQSALETGNRQHLKD